MRPDEHLRMHQFEDHYWWFVGRKAILATLLERHLAPAESRRILDVGCGSGATLELLTAYGEAWGLDPSRVALRLCRERGLDRLVLGDAVQLPFAEHAFHLVTLLDVLEHIPDDVAALREIRRVLRPAGQLLLTVPAYQFLWSEHDEALDHCRRYTARQVAYKLREGGFTIQRLTYCITLLLPAATVLRLGQRLRPKPPDKPRCALVELPGPLNGFCLATLHLEARLLRHANLPCGVSVAAVAGRA